MIWDLAIIETGGGGDLTINGNDLAVFNSVENQLYLAWFGGNVEADTKTTRLPGEQDFSYWGNTFIKNINAQFNSLTERTLNTTPLTSNGRVTIQNAMKKDLSALSKTNNINVDVVIDGPDKILITLTAIMPDGSEQIKTFALVKNQITGDFDLRDFDFRDFF